MIWRLDATVPKGIYGQMMSGAWTTCPGCGLRMPRAEGPAGARPGASPECHGLYGELAARALSDPRLARFHQLSVDTYAAQHAHPEDPPIGTAFALLGLHWALDRGLSGNQVRAAHQRLAEATASWPPFDRPRRTGQVTVFEVAAAGSWQEHRDLLYRWARSVWAAWAPAHARVEELTKRHWPAIAQAAARAAPQA
jgi:hypothetical protein